MREGKRGEEGGMREGEMERALERRRKRALITPQFPRSPPEI